MIDNTTSDLQELLQRFGDARSDSELSETDDTQPSEIESPDMAEDRANIEACLAVCAKVAEHIDEVQSEYLNGRINVRKQNNTVKNKFTPAGEILVQRLKGFKTELGMTTAELRVRKKEIDQRIEKLSQQTQNGESSAAGLDTAREISEEINSINDCLSIVQDATEQVTSQRINTYEDVEVEDDSNQILVNTFGDLIAAKHVKAGSRSTQLVGHVSDEAFMHASTAFTARHIPREMPPKKKDKEGPSREHEGEEGSYPNSFSSRWGGQYGTGRKM